MKNYVPGLLEHKVDTALVNIVATYLSEFPQILESGVFIGSWCISVNNHISHLCPKFIGIEDLSFVKDKQVLEWYKNFNREFETLSRTQEFGKIQTIKDLEKFIQSRCFKYTEKELKIKLYTHKPGFAAFDMIHHDCGLDYSTNKSFFEYYHKNLKDTGILIVDNFGTDVPMRTLSVTDMILRGQFYIIGLGKRKLILSKNKQTAKTYLEKIKNHTEQFSLNTGCNLIFTVDTHLGQEYFFMLPISRDINLPVK